MRWRIRLALALTVLAPVAASSPDTSGGPARGALQAQESKLLRYYYSPWGSMCIGPCPDVRPVLCCRVDIPE